MTHVFFRSYQCEWMKIRHTPAVHLVIFGALLIPMIMLIAQLYAPQKLSYDAAPQTFWMNLYLHTWEFMSVLLLPFGIILITSMLTQIEFKNSTWKQALITPQSLTTIFFAKLSVIMTLLLIFFVAFNSAILISGILPGMFHPDISIPHHAPPLTKMTKDLGAMWLTCLPIVGLQYTLSIRFSNFSIPIGIGLVCIIASVFALQWKDGYLVPFAYNTFHYMVMSGQEKFKFPYSIYTLSLIWFIGFVGTGYISFLYRKYKA